MEDSEGGPQMNLRIKPLWDPTGSVAVEVDDDRHELVVRAGGELFQFVLREFGAELVAGEGAGAECGDGRSARRTGPPVSCSSRCAVRRRCARLTCSTA